MKKNNLFELMVVIKGAGDLASGVAWRLFQANFKKILMLEVPRPLSVRRMVSFCEAVTHGKTRVEGIQAVRVKGKDEIFEAWNLNQIPVLVDPQWNIIRQIQPDVVVDAILAKRNLGTTIQDAQLVIGLGPGFCGGTDVNAVIETNRGPDLGRVILSGSAQPDTGVPGEIKGFTEKRVLRAPVDGVFKSRLQIGDIVRKGDLLGKVDGRAVKADIYGKVRGLIMDNIHVTKGLKIGDIDPRGDIINCSKISDKALAIGGGVLEVILREYNK